MAEKLQNTKQMITILDKCYDLALNGLPKIKSDNIITFAESYLNKYNDIEIASEVLIKNQIKKCGTSGFINGMEKDYVTAASYFYEAFENYYSLNMKNELITALKYLILMKLMQKRIGDIEILMVNKHIVIHSDNTNIVALNEIAKAFEKRNVDEYNKTIKKYTNELLNDEFIKENLDMLYNELLQENICRILEPYSSIELSHISKLINIDVYQIEKILRLMIIENKINGIIDQNRGILILHEDIDSNRILSAGISLIGELNKLVDTLNEKAVKVIQETTVSQIDESK